MWSSRRLCFIVNEDKLRTFIGASIDTYPLLLREVSIVLLSQVEGERFAEAGLR